MNFQSFLRSVLCLGLLCSFLTFGVFAQDNKTTPAQELARKVAALQTDAERFALLEGNKELPPLELRKALFQEALRRRVTGNYDEAIALDLFTRAYSEKVGDRAGVAEATNNIGINYQEIGQYRTAVEYYKRSLELKAPLNDRFGIASSSNNLGLSYIYLGEYRLAQEFLESSLKILTELDRRDALPTPINNLGIIQRRLGNAERAQGFYERSLKLCEEIKNKNCAAQALGNLAILKTEAEDFPAALEFQRKSLALREELNNKSGVATSFGNIANIYLAQNDLPQALAFYEKQLKIVEEIKSQGSLATVLNNIANLKLKTARYAEALDYADRAAALAQKIGAEDTLWNAFQYRGAAYRQLKKTQQARESLDAAIKIIEARRLQAVGGGTQNFFSNKIEPYHEAVALMFEQGDEPAALDYAERAKARALLDILSSEPVEIGKLLTADEKKRERETNNRIALLNAQILRERARAPQPDAERLKLLEAELEKARVAYEDFRAAIYAAHPELRAQRGEAKIISQKEIADALLKEPNKILLEYVVANEATYLFAVTKTNRRAANASSVDVKIYKIPITKEELARRTEDFRQAIAARGAYEKSARELYELLVAPAAKDLAGKTKIVVVPDGALWNLPFQALQTKTNRFLLEDYVLSYAPSLTALREMRKIADKKRAVSKTEKTLFAFGNPTFDVPENETAAVAVLRGESLGALPDAEREVGALANLYGAASSRIYVKTEAREDRAKTEGRDYRILQFAAHGVFNDANPLYSYLVLAPNQATGDDGLLEAREILDLNLSADLVVLSACETARGRVSAGEGLTGMTWALFVAGVPTTVASQWKVPSNGTAEVMLGFHRNLIKSGKSADKAAALRQSELDFLRGGTSYRHPFYWAGFILVGND